MITFDLSFKIKISKLSREELIVELFSLATYFRNKILISSSGNGRKTRIREFLQKLIQKFKLVARSKIPVTKIWSGEKFLISPLNETVTFVLKWNAITYPVQQTIKFNFQQILVPYGLG